MATTKVKVVFHKTCVKRSSNGKRCLKRLKSGGKPTTVVFSKKGTKESLCKRVPIRIKGKTFMGRRGGRALCGPSTGKNSASAKAARRLFAKMAKGSKRRRSRR